MPRGLFLASALTLTVTACGAKTQLEEPPESPTHLQCPTEAIGARPGVPVRIDLTLPTGAGRVVWSAPTGVHLDESAGATAWATVNTEGRFTVTATLADNNPDGGVETCDLRLDVRARGPIVHCPATVVTEPLTEVRLTATASGDRPIVTRRWSLDSAPSSSGHPNTDNDGESTRFTPDVAGDYRLRFTVTDRAEQSATCTTLVRAVPHEGLRVELSWDPVGRTCPDAPGAACDSSDVDLHLLRDPGTGTSWRSDDDCYYLNCNTSASRTLPWGRPGRGDDPRLDIDDVSGHGPENINIDSPTSTRYRIGVHYYSTHGAGPQVARLTVYCNGTVVSHLGPVVLRNGGSPDLGDFWIAADLRPSSSGGCTSTTITRPDGSPWVISYANALDMIGPP